MYLRNVSSINHCITSEQKKSQKAAIGGGKLNKCLRVLVLIFQPLGALLTWGLFVVIAAFLILIAALFLIGRAIFGKRKLCLTKQKHPVPFCKQRSEGVTSLLFIFLIFAGMHTFLLSWVLPIKEILSQSKGTPIQGDQGTATEYL